MPPETPPPLLPPLDENASIQDVEGRLLLSIGPFGETAAAFETERLDRNLDWMRLSGPRDLRADLPGGRSVELRGCYTKRITFSLGENQAPPRVELAPSGGITVGVLTPEPCLVECALCNLWIPEIPPLRFDGLDLEFCPAEAGGPSYTDLQKGDFARVTWWARCTAPADGHWRQVVEVLRCFADVASLLVDERVRVPCYRLVDQGGDTVLFHSDNVQWPRIRKRNWVYTRREREALERVGAVSARDVFEELSLHKYVDMIWEADRDDVFLETSLLCAVVALEHVTYHYELSEGEDPATVQEKNLVQKLRHLNTSLRFIGAEYTGDWLREDLRNPIVHTGAVPGMDAGQLLEATEKLLLLARDILFRLLGFDRTTG